MNPDTPIADPNGPRIPTAAVAPPAPQPHIPAATPVQGAAQSIPAPPARRNRNPRGIVSPSTSSGPSGAPAMLEIAAAYPMYTEQRREANLFNPDSQMLFHVLGICDMLMNSTDRFLRSSPAWIPIVSQLYISILWNVHLLRVFVNTGYGGLFSRDFDALFNDLQISECMIPGPLVPFFQSIAAVNGPFEWIGDISPAILNLANYWDAENFHPTADTARTTPFPVIMLDQLYYFSSRAVGANVVAYTDFQWYHNIFGINLGAQNALHRINPQSCGSLFCSQAQFDSARAFWNPAMQGFTRITTAEDQHQLTDVLQFFGFVSQDGIPQTTWFQHVVIVMQKYCQYFNGSVPLKSVLPTGIGAVVITGRPSDSTAARDFIYPANNAIEPFASNRFEPRRAIPAALQIVFCHADHELEEQAEQYAILSHTNIAWDLVTAQNNLTAINPAHFRHGSYWTMPPFRFSSPITLKTQYAQIIASRYHQQAANRAQ
ncbi:ORF1 [Amaranthus cryptic virus 3]|nr:ORF1 [Amaranthus cryptic virus 3]